jgi:hypothetical protein
MADNSGWMGDPNDIQGKRLFEQSKKALNPDKAAKDAAAKAAANAKAKLAAKLAAEKAAKTLRQSVPAKSNPNKYKSPGFNGFDGTQGFSKKGPWG